MKNAYLYSIAVLSLAFAEQAHAEKFELGPVKADLRLNLDLQVAQIVSDDSETSPDRTETNLDWAARLKLSTKVSPDIDLGTVIKIDQDFDNDSQFSMRDEGINLRLAYVYAKSKFGELAIGQKSGQADRLFLHAPQVGVGQIRGDFSRYGARSALLNPYDTQNAFKFDFRSPKQKPVIFGVSYAPEIRDRRDNSLRQKDAVEFAILGQTKISEKWKLSGTLSYVFGQSEIEKREDINSWGAGAKAAYKKKWTISGAYVYRGDSDTRPGFDEDEINFGVKYRHKKWQAGFSTAIQSNDVFDRNLIGLGGEYKVHKNARIRLSGSLFSNTSDNVKTTGAVIISDLRLNY